MDQMRSLHVMANWYPSMTFETYMNVRFAGLYFLHDSLYIIYRVKYLLSLNISTTWGNCSPSIVNSIWTYVHLLIFQLVELKYLWH